LAYGVAFDHMFTDRLSAELAVTSQHVERRVATISTDVSGQVTSSTYSDAITPIDATVNYHFVNDSRWKPYLGGGVRYVSNTITFRGGPLGPAYLKTRTTDPEIAGGVIFQLRPNIGLRLDAKQTWARGPGSSAILISKCQSAQASASRFIR
jgi:outer membrane protein W